MKDVKMPKQSETTRTENSNSISDHDFKAGSALAVVCLTAAFAIEHFKPGSFNKAMEGPSLAIVIGAAILAERISETPTDTEFTDTTVINKASALTIPPL